MKKIFVKLNLYYILFTLCFVFSLSCSSNKTKQAGNPVSKESAGSEIKNPTEKKDSNITNFEGRAIWVTRGDYRTPNDVKKIIKNCADYNFNQILFQVRGNGTVFYKSQIEPWAYELTSQTPQTTGKDPGWNPLQLAIEEAHKRGIQLHAYMNVFPGWRSQKYPPKEAKQLWTEHPDWFMVDKKGNKMIPRDKSVDKKFDTWYSFINPANPEVQKYVTELFLEIVKNYDIDGIHYDYVRFPGEIDDFSYDKISLERFKAETGKTPDSDPSEWNKWRGKQITTIVRSINQNAKKIKPNLIFSAAVVGDYDRALTRYFQPSREWMKEGILDIAMPMLYRQDLEEYENFIKDLKKNSSGKFVYPGIGGHLKKTGEEIAKYIEAARELGADGNAIFAYSSLFNNHIPNEKVKYIKDNLYKTPIAPPLLNK